MYNTLDKLFVNKNVFEFCDLRSLERYFDCRALLSKKEKVSIQLGLSATDFIYTSMMGHI